MTGVGSRKRFARGAAGLAGRPARPLVDATETSRFGPLRAYWESRRRCPVADANDYAHPIAIQAADAVMFTHEGLRHWVEYARIDRIAPWRDLRGVAHTEALRRVRETTDVDVDAALRLASVADTIAMPWKWRGCSLVTAACLEDNMRAAWLNNARGGRQDPVVLTAWAWLVATYLDVPWDAVPADWSDQPYPCTSAMAHVAGRVLDRQVPPMAVGYLFGKRDVGAAACGLQMVGNEYGCGLGGPDECEGAGRSCPCPLIDNCESYRLGKFPHRGPR